MLHVYTFSLKIERVDKNEVYFLHSNLTPHLIHSIPTCACDKDVAIYAISTLQLGKWDGWAYNPGLHSPEHGPQSNPLSNDMCALTVMLILSLL